MGVTAADYAGAEVCAKCHPSQFAAQSSSAHANALAPSKPPQHGLWAFGAGVQAITFVSRVDPESYIEQDETWYRKINGIGRTPGHRCFVQADELGQHAARAGRVAVLTQEEAQIARRLDRAGVGGAELLLLPFEGL